VGARTPAQVDGWIQAAFIELTAVDLKEIPSAVKRTKAGSGPTIKTIAKRLAKGRPA
jgi:hypothetical protein